MPGKTWPPELRNFMFDILSQALMDWSSNQIALTARLRESGLKRFVEDDIIQRRGGSTLYYFNGDFVDKIVALVLDKWFPKEEKERVSEKASKSPDAYSLSVIKQAAKTIRQKIEAELTQTAPGDQIREVWLRFALNDDGLFLIPDVFLYHEGGSHVDFTEADLERYRVSLEGKED